jgi:hypothetical protein
LVLGPEPALRWRMFTEQIVGIAQRFDAAMVLTVGALLADVAHSKPVQVMGTATDQEIIDRFDLQRSRYEGPTGIVGVLHDACQRAGISSASLWAAVPAYASQLPSPKAALALVGRACMMIGTPTPIGRLGHESADYEARVTSMVSDDDDLIGYVARLETMGYDDLDEGDRFDTQSGYIDDDEDDDDDPAFADIADDELDSDEFMAEVEQFLREQPEQ